jgi:rhodanese-related sulfurtransferase
VVRQIDVRQLAAKLKAAEPVYLLDVRQQWEHDTAALPASVLVPLDQLVARAGDIRPPEGAAVVAYCHHGVRSLMAAELLERLGFTHVVSLAGGIDAWSLAVDPSVPRY